MRWRSYLLRATCVLVVCAVLCWFMPGCSDDTVGRQSVLPQFTGAFAGTFSRDSTGNTSDVGPGPLGSLNGSVSSDGRISMTVGTLTGEYPLTGTIYSNNTVVASGVVNGDLVRFHGTWATNLAAGMAGTWEDQRTGARGAWSFAQTGLSATNLQGAYNGNFTTDGQSGYLVLFLAPNGTFTGDAGGVLPATVTPVTGALNQENQIYLTGTTAAGDPLIIFIGTLDPATRTVTDGTNAANLNGGTSGTWTMTWGT